MKPGNLFVVTGDDGRPTVKLLDFGIASMRATDAAGSEGKSSAPRSQGTPAYLSPEQLRGGAPADHRADVWALGCVLYELLSNEKPFRATRFTELVTKILEASPEPLPGDVEIPAPLVAVIMRCLDKDRVKRFSSTGQLALALLPFARRRAHSSVSRAVAHVKTGGLDPDLEMPSSMPPPPVDSDPVLVPRAGAVPSFAPDSTPRGAAERSRVPVAVALVIGILGLGAAAFAVSRGGPPPAGPAQAPVAPPSTSVAVPTATTPPAAAPIASVSAQPEVTPSAEPPPAVTAVMTAKPRPAAPPRPRASATNTPPAGPEAEIRRER